MMFVPTKVAIGPWPVNVLVCTENLIRVDDALETPKLTE
jgi:hypothetical protein